MSWNPIDDIPPMSQTELAEVEALACAIVDPDHPDAAKGRGRSLRELAIRLHAVLTAGPSPLLDLVDLHIRLDASLKHSDAFIAESAQILKDYDDLTLMEALTIIRNDRGRHN